MTLAMPAKVAAAVLLVASLGSGADAQPGIDPRDAAREIHRVNDYPEGIDIADGQGSVRSFPATGGGAGDSGERRALGRSGRTDLDDLDAIDARRAAEPRRESSWRFPSLSGLGGLGQIFSWILIALAAIALAALLGYLLYTFWPGRDRSAPDESAELEAPLVTAAGLPFETGDPDALAAEGRFEEAIVALLVQCLRAVGWRPSVESSHTAREILWALPLSDGRRAPLGAVVEGAERVRFADAPATREAFEALRPHRDAIVAARGPAEEAA